MKLHYYPETDSLYIELRDAPGAETREVADGVNIDFNSDGAIVGIDVEKAGQNQIANGLSPEARRWLE